MIMSQKAVEHIKAGDVTAAGLEEKPLKRIGG